MIAIKIINIKLVIKLVKDKKDVNIKILRLLFKIEINNT